MIKLHRRLNLNSYPNKLVQVFQINQDKSLIYFLFKKYLVDSFLIKLNQDSNLQMLKISINIHKLNKYSKYLNRSLLNKTYLLNNNLRYFCNNKTWLLLLLTRLLLYNKTKFLLLPTRLLRNNHTRFLITLAKLCSHRQHNILNPCNNYTCFNLILKTFLFSLAYHHSVNQVPLILFSHHIMLTRCSILLKP